MAGELLDRGPIKPKLDGAELEAMCKALLSDHIEEALEEFAIFLADNLRISSQIPRRVEFKQSNLSLLEFDLSTISRKKGMVFFRSICTELIEEMRPNLDGNAIPRKALFWLAKIYESKREPYADILAFRIMQRAAERNVEFSDSESLLPYFSVRAYFELARYYEEGIGVETNLRIAIEYYYRAASDFLKFPEGYPYRQRVRSEAISSAEHIDYLAPESHQSNIMFRKIFADQIRVLGEYEKQVESRVGVASTGDDVAPDGGADKSKESGLGESANNGSTFESVLDRLESAVFTGEDVRLVSARIGPSMTLFGNAPESSSSNIREFRDAAPPNLVQLALVVNIAFSRSLSFVSIYAPPNRQQIILENGQHTGEEDSAADGEINSNSAQGQFSMSYDFLGLFYQPRRNFWIGVGPLRSAFEITADGESRSLDTIDYVTYLSVNNADYSIRPGSSGMTVGFEVLLPVVKESFITAILLFNIGYSF